MEKIVAVHFPSNALRSKILKKATDVFGKTDVRQVYLFILLIAKISHHYRRSCVIFIQLFSIDIGDASWENIHAAIFSVIVD